MNIQKQKKKSNGNGKKTEPVTIWPQPDNAGRQMKPNNPLKSLVRPARFELATYGFVDQIYGPENRRSLFPDFKGL